MKLEDFAIAKTIYIAQTNIPDCFVQKNKIGSGNGEAKLYVGGSKSREWSIFFNNFDIKGLVLKSDLLTYLELAKLEYEVQSQNYKNDISKDWVNYYSKVMALEDYALFTISHKEFKNTKRYYINSNDSIYQLLRKICLPIVSSLIIEIIEVDGKRFAWFRPFINEIGNVFENEIIDKQIASIATDETIIPTSKEQIIKARLGQGKFRDLVLDRCYRSCAVTGVNDVRMLIASHIKPWSVSSNVERLSCENGLLLVPTLDKLFDRGFISFRNNGKIILSEHFADGNFAKLRIDNTMKCSFIDTTTVKLNLDYHRDIVLKTSKK